MNGGAPDLREFVALLDRHSTWFDRKGTVHVARAPGRIDLMGGIADYAGSLVLQWPLAAATFVAVQACADPDIAMLSPGAAAFDSEPLVTLPRAVLLPDAAPLSYPAARLLFARDAKRRWAAYVAGALVVLRRERGIDFPFGLRIMIHSAVPPGKGLSSSAALEVATMQAVCALRGLTLDGHETARLCQTTENLVAGAPCGIMDQMTSACGREGEILALLCQPAEIKASVALPADLEVWGIDCGLRHSVSGEEYETTRVGMFMGYSMIAQRAGLTRTELGQGRVRIDDPLWHGYLANISPSLWETCFRGEIPVEERGARFLDVYGGITDPATRVRRKKTYRVLHPTAHAIYEHHRIRVFWSLLSRGRCQDDDLLLLGELMYQSHASYSACGLGTRETDLIVELVRQGEMDSGLFGARVTGGGVGGTVAVLARRGAEGEVRRIAAEYTERTGHQSAVFGGSSPGALEFGGVKLNSA